MIALKRSKSPGYALLLALFLFLGTAGTGFGQSGSESFSTSSATVMANARILYVNVNLITLRDVRFDRVQPSQGIIRVDPITNSNAGLMKAEGAARAAVQISFQSRVQLIHETGTSTLVMNYELAGNAQENQANADMVTNGSQNFQLNENGDFFIWVGGSIDITNAISGNYEGDFTVEVEYI